MKNASILLVGVAVLLLGAGVLTGMLASRLPVAIDNASVVDRSELEVKLNLTSDQREQMQKIWEKVRSQVQESFADAQTLQRDRDAAILKILNDQQKAQFEKIAQDFSKQNAEMLKRRDQLFAQAVADTMKILTPEQRPKYEQILKERFGSVPTTNPSNSIGSADLFFFQNSRS